MLLRRSADRLDAGGRSAVAGDRARLRRFSARHAGARAVKPATVHVLTAAIFGRVRILQVASFSARRDRRRRRACSMSTCRRLPMRTMRLRAFPAKWMPVCVAKVRQNKKLERVPIQLERKKALERDRFRWTHFAIVARSRFLAWSRDRTVTGFHFT